MEKMRNLFSLILFFTLFSLPALAQGDKPPTELKEAAPRPKVFSKPGFLRPVMVNQKRTDPWSSNARRRHHPDTIAASKPLAKDTTIVIDPGKSLVFLERSNLIRFDNEILPDIQVLEGNVLLRHEGALLYCDSAYLNQSTNSFEAFGRVRMEQGDTLVVTAENLLYDGNRKTAYLRYKVRLRNRNVTLETDSMTYERDINLGYYKCGGTMNDGRTTLLSRHGYYHTDTKMAELKYDVVGYNEDSRIESDTLTYNTDTKVAGLVGPTVIYNQDHDDPDSVLTVIHSDLGWYDTGLDQAELLNHSQVIHDRDNFITGDTIFYDNRNGFGKMFSNIEMNDTTNHMMLRGHYGFYQEDGEIALVTDSACFINYARPDTIFAHADTLYSFAVDSNKVALAYHNGRIYSKQYQAVSDSIVFNTVDSITHLLQIPLFWSDSIQVTGDTVRIYPKGEALDYAHVKGNATIIQQRDSIHFNQISGKDILAYLADSTIEHIEVLGNAESIFYPEDKGRFIGLNHMTSSSMFAYFLNGDIHRINVFPKPHATLYPMEKINENMLKLANFTWQIETRPKDRDDIFNRPKRASKEELEDQKRDLREKQKAERRKKRAEKDKEESKKDKDKQGSTL